MGKSSYTEVISTNPRLWIWCIGLKAFILLSLKVKPCFVKYILGKETAAGKLLMTRSQRWRQLQILTNYFFSSEWLLVEPAVCVSDLYDVFLLDIVKDTRQNLWTMIYRSQWPPNSMRPLTVSDWTSIQSMMHKWIIFSVRVCVGGGGGGGWRLG